MDAIVYGLFQEVRTSYSKVNSLYWGAVVALAGWTGVYAMNGREIIGSWWQGGDQLNRLMLFCFIFCVIAYFHNKQLHKLNEARKKALEFIIEQNILSESIRVAFDQSASSFDIQYKEVQKNYLTFCSSFLLFMLFHTRECRVLRYFNVA